MTNPVVHRGGVYLTAVASVTIPQDNAIARLDFGTGSLLARNIPLSSARGVQTFLGGNPDDFYWHVDVGGLYQLNWTMSLAPTSDALLSAFQIRKRLGSAAFAVVPELTDCSLDMLQDKYYQFSGSALLQLAPASDVELAWGASGGSEAANVAAFSASLIGFGRVV